MTQIDGNTGSSGPGAFVTGTGGNPGSYGGFQVPDVVANLRVDQAWGSAQIMAAYHDVNSQYYINGTPGSGGPGDKAGFAVGAGLKLNAPMIGQGDFLQAQVNYTEGALKYIFQTPNTNWGKVDGNTIAFGVLSDAVFQSDVAPTANASSAELTTGWGVNAAYEHFWNPRWRTSLYGGYAAVSYNDRANAMVCVFDSDGTGRGTAAVANPGCNNNWSTWWVGSRTQWNVTKDFYMGVDVLYSKLQTASSSTGLAPGQITGGSCIQGPAVGQRCALDDQDNLMFRFRVHRDFYP